METLSELAALAAAGKALERARDAGLALLLRQKLQLTVRQPKAITHLMTLDVK